MKKIITVIIASFALLGTVAYAEAQPMPDEGAERIKWAVSCCGSAPVWFYIAAALLVICAVSAMIYYKKSCGGDD